MAANSVLSPQSSVLGSVRDRRRHALRRLFWRRVGVLGFYAVAALALWQFLTAPFWYIQSVEVQTSSPELRRGIAEALQKRSPGLEGAHLLLVHPWRIRRDLQGLSQVRQAVVTRRLWPTRVTIDVGERLPLARLALPARQVLQGVDGDGVTFPLVPHQRPATPLRFRARRVPLSPGQSALIRGSAGAWQARPFPAVGVIDISDPQRIQVRYRGVRWLLGDSARLPQKLSLLPHLWPLLAHYREALDYVNLSDPHNPVLKIRLPRPAGQPKS